MARYDLGLKKKELFSLTPRLLDALIRRHERATRDRELLFGQLTSCVVNFSMVHPKQPTRPADFMPSEWAKRPVKAKRINRKAIANSARSNMDMFIRFHSRGQASG